jgi:hypothetical protein
VRSWEEAVSFTQRELDAAGDLAGRLEDYALTAARLSDTIDVLDQAQPALELIGRLREVRVPLVGSGWQILLALLSIATVDGAKLLGELEETLRALTALKDSLDNLTGLSDVADAIRAFRATPDRRTLAALDDTGARVTPSMRQLHADLGGILDPLDDIARNLSRLVQGLRSVAESDIPVVSDAAGTERIGLIEGPLFTVRDGLNQLHEDIGADIEILTNIQEAVRQAREHEE